MKRRAPAPPRTPASGVPPELAIGRCIEVWAEDGTDRLSAFRRYAEARTAWENERGLSRQESDRLLPRHAGSPWSANYLTKQGRGAVVRDRLALHGVTVDQLEQLRAAAARWV